MLCHPPDIGKKIPLWARMPFRQGQAGFCPQTVQLALFLSGMLKTFQRQQTNFKTNAMLKKSKNKKPPPICR